MVDHIVTGSKIACYKHYELGNGDEIRILNLNPREWNEPLSGSLTCKNLNNKPTYHALSYTWGNPDLCCVIRIDGMDLAITDNLYSALRRLRSKNRKFPVWADGICINQNDISERNQQVLLMKRIYNQCYEGLIYLGEEENSSSLIPGFLQELYQGFLAIQDAGKPRDWLMPEPDFLSLPLPDMNHPGWAAFRELLRRPWFHRIWIIQEFAFPNDVFMICGQWKIDATWFSLITFLNFVIAMPLLTGDPRIIDEINPRAMTALYYHGWIRHRQGQRNGILHEYLSLLPQEEQAGVRYTCSIRNLLSIGKMCNATDPRDHYFALLGLANDIDHSDLVADYSKSLEDVEKQFARHFIRGGFGVQLLRLTCLSDKSANILPSWIPEFKNSSSKAIVSYQTEMLNSNIPSSCIRLAQNEDFLLLQGYKLDRIKVIGMEKPADRSDRRDWILQVESLTADIVNYPTGQSVEEAKWRTIIANKTLEGEIPPAGYADMYQSFREIELNPGKRNPRETIPIELSKIRPRASTFAAAVGKILFARFCISNDGFFGLVPHATQVGDIIFTFQEDREAETFILRKNYNDCYYTWVGYAYIHDILRGRQFLSRVPELCEITVC